MLVCEMEKAKYVEAFSLSTKFSFKKSQIVMQVC